MDKNSYLNPTLIKAQCEVAIRKLEKDNDAYHVAEKSLDDFIRDEEIKSTAFDALKQQIADYKTVLQALRSANDSDIADFKTLSGTVGDEVLDGSEIVLQQELALNTINTSEDLALFYEEKARNASFESEEFYYMTTAKQQRRIAVVCRELYAEWVKKAQQYDSIELLTKDLFSAGRELRTVANSGLQSIAGAYADGVYRPDINASWRTDIADFYIERVITVTEDGEVIINMEEVEKILSKDAEDITPQEYDAIALAYLNADEEELGLFLQCMMGERVDVDVSLLDQALGIWGGNGFWYQSHTEWKADEQKLAKLQERLTSTAESSLVLLQWYRRVPDNEMVQEMIQQRDVILQRTTLLEVVEEVGTFRGEAGVKYPNISVSNGEDGALVLEFCESRNTVGPTAPAIISDLATSKVIIGETLLGTQIDKNVVEGMEYRFCNRFGTYSVAEETAGFVFDEFSGDLVSDTMDEYAEYVTDTLGKKALGKAIGYVPIIGDIAGFSVEVIQDTMQAEADAAIIEEEFTALKSAEIYSDFDCCANFVQYDTADNSSMVIYAYAGERTDEIIGKLNTELGSTWTREQLFKNTNEVWDWVRELSGDGFDKYDEVIKQKGEEK